MDAASQIILAIVSALGGATLLGVVREWFGRDAKRLDDVSAFRRELLDRVRELERTAAALEQKLDDWQQRYYALKAENESLKGQIGELLARLAHYEIPAGLPPPPPAANRHEGVVLAPPQATKPPEGG